jgi:uncharacterized protein (DUF488 family)
MNTIYTIGHSTRPIQLFLDMLQSFDIKVVADIRSFPRSRWMPHFNQKALAASLEGVGTRYIHFPELGGKEAYEGQPKFSERLAAGELAGPIASLTSIAEKEALAYMCSEGDWRICHRANLSTHLQEQGWNVQHIMEVGKTEPHEPAKQKKLF